MQVAVIRTWIAGIMIVLLLSAALLAFAILYGHGAGVVKRDENTC